MAKSPKSSKKSPSKSPKAAKGARKSPKSAPKKPKAAAKTKRVSAPKLTTKPVPAKPLVAAPSPAPVESAAPAVSGSLALALAVARNARDDKCTNVVVLDVRGLSPVTDYLVLATGSSGRQMRSAADSAIDIGKESGNRPLSSSGLEGETWICVDFVDVLFHVFGTDSRSYYDLEGLWGDANRVPLE